MRYLVVALALLAGCQPVDPAKYPTIKSIHDCTDEKCRVILSDGRHATALRPIIVGDRVACYVLDSLCYPM